MTLDELIAAFDERGISREMVAAFMCRLIEVSNAIPRVRAWREAGSPLFGSETFEMLRAHERIQLSPREIAMAAAVRSYQLDRWCETSQDDIETLARMTDGSWKTFFPTHLLTPYARVIEIVDILATDSALEVVGLRYPHLLPADFMEYRLTVH